MHSDILLGRENTKTTTLPKVDNAGRWSNYESSKKDITVSLGNFAITELHAGYSYSQLQSFFQIVNFLVIRRFISQNKFVYNALLEIKEVIKKYFPEEDLRLELYEDPEGEMENELAIYILTCNEPHTALYKLDQFDREYWVEKIDQYENFITVNIEYL